MKSIVYTVLFLCVLTQVKAQELQWTTFNQLSTLQQKQARPLLIFVHTSWCSVCVMQKEISFKDPELIKLLNENFYSIELNAEDQNSIKFLGRTYRFIPSHGTHQLATILTKSSQQLIYPSIVLLDKNYKIKTVLNSYQSPEQLTNYLSELIIEDGF